MKFVVNTNYNNAAGIMALEGILKRLEPAGHNLVRNDWENYKNYDVAIFTAPDSKVREAKKINHKIFTIIFDPKATRSWQIEEMKAADLLIVSSIEQRDFLCKFNKNTFIYYMFPDFPEIKKIHEKHDKIIIGYHGNKQHLDAMSDVSWALDELAKEHNIEFWAVYNVKKLGKWRLNLPKNCPVRHVQWEEATFMQELSKCDIGIWPSVLPAPKFFARPILSLFYNPAGYNKNDYLLRFKMSNNPNRLYVFSQLYLPVVADFTPSSCQIIKDGESGLLVGTKEGWKNALLSLIDSHELRENLSQNLKKHIDTACSIDLNFKQFISLLNSFYATK